MSAAIAISGRFLFSSGADDVGSCDPGRPVEKQVDVCSSLNWNKYRYFLGVFFCMCVFLSASRMARALGGLALVLAGVGAAAQTQFTLNGVDYELVTWPAATAAADIISDTWAADFGDGYISVMTNGQSEDQNRINSDLTWNCAHTAQEYAAIGYDIANIPCIRINKGQHDANGAAMITTYNITASTLPTELLFYAGSDVIALNNGLKYTRWDWTSSQSGTKFEVLADSGSFAVENDGTPVMSWRTFGNGSDGTDSLNKAMALVRITNPAGISNFSVESNRLDASGDFFQYSNAAQRADHSGMNILIRKPATTVSPQAIPTLGAGALALLLAALSGIGAWVLRRRGETWRWMNVGVR